MSDFTYFTLTQDTVTGTARDLSMLHPFLANIVMNEAPTDEWVALVNAADSAILDAIIDVPSSDATVSATFPEGTVGIMVRAVQFVDRLLTITQEEIDKANATTEEDA
jgi:hypothetical protein